MAKKKIYDIVPPKKKEEFFGQEVSPTKEKKSQAPKGSSEAKALLPPKRFVFSPGNFLLIFALVIMAVIFYWFFSSANKVQVDIWPQLNPLTVNASIAFSTSTTELNLGGADFSTIVMPAEFMETQKIFTKQFPSTEVAIGDKARGIIRVYNKYSRAVTLVEGTRFLSSSEPTKQFHAQQKINVPAGGYVDVPVIASEPGDSYNIEPCAFSIPGLRNYSPPQLYYDVFGKSFAKMEGGREENVFRVTQEDFAKAQKELLDASQQEIKTVLQKEGEPDYKFLEKTIKLELIKGGPIDVEVGQETPNFVYQIETKVSAIRIKNAFLTDFAKQYLRLSVPVTKGFSEEFLKVEILAGNDEREPVLSLAISTQVYSQIDKETLKEIIKNRTRKEIFRYVLEIYPNVSKPPRISFIPFWARKALSNMEAIDIKLNFK